MKYPKVFKIRELILMPMEELKELDDATYQDWQRVRQAIVVKRAFEEEEE
tara:strand:- start:214 stop:363 length:150 start_codon:yes stop_codon:yes gene_type:complete